MKDLNRSRYLGWSIYSSTININISKYPNITVSHKRTQLWRLVFPNQIIQWIELRNLHFSCMSDTIHTYLHQQDEGCASWSHVINWWNAKRSQFEGPWDRSKFPSDRRRYRRWSLKSGICITAYLCRKTVLCGLPFAIECLTLIDCYTILVYCEGGYSCCAWWDL